ncbi:MAG: hypothetical protein JO100_17455 [Pseudonocardia sp.]|nr:hypothetical protein [Pseudonocardia sp.]
MAGLVDSGGWRATSITHWHLVAHEALIMKNGRPNPERFDGEILAPLIAAGLPECDPHRALEWVFTRHINGLVSSADPAARSAQRGWRSEADVVFSIETAWEFMTDKAGLLTPIGSGVEIKPNLALDCHAHPMTLALCRAHGHPE